MHQGVAADLQPLPAYTVEELVAEARRAGRCSSCSTAIEDPQNVGAILRSADAAGAHGVIRQARHAAPLDGATAKASAGAVNHVRIATVVNIARAIDELKALNVWTIGLDAVGAPTPTMRWTTRLPTAFVVGAEGHGAAPAGPGDLRPAGVHPDGWGCVEPECLGFGRGGAVRGGPAAAARMPGRRAVRSVRSQMD